MTNKTQPTTYSVVEFLKSYPNPKCTEDYLALDQLFQQVTGYKAVLWGKIIGYGAYHYKYASGREGDAMISGFAPSKTGMTIYLNCSGGDFRNLLDKLGKHKLKGSCLHISRLADIDTSILGEIIKQAAEKLMKTDENTIKNSIL